MSANQQIVFIDSQVADYQLLAQGILPGIEVVLIKSDKSSGIATQRDGISQITEVLSQRNNYTSIHIVSHGSPGCLYLGNTQLSLDTLNQYTKELRSWFSSSSLNQNPLSLKIYGCNVAAGDAGEEFITKLHDITGVEIAASTTPIGNEKLGGNWELDVATNAIDTTLAINKTTQHNYAGILAYVVSGTAFNDYDSDGVNDGTARGVGFADESGYEGIVVTAYDSTENVVGTATTGTDGSYTLNVNTSDAVRLEFTLPVGYVVGGLPGISADTVANVAFVDSTTTVDLGIHRSHEATTGDASSIELITVCYVEGVGSSGNSAIIIHNYNDFEDQSVNGYTEKANVQEIGSVNGLAYHRESETLFAGSFYKRHSALKGTIDYTNDNDGSAETNNASGEAYTTIIYTVDNSNNNPSGNVAIFARLDDVVDPRGAVDDDSGYSWDSDQGTSGNTAGGNAVFDAVGKYGLGDLELSADGKHLWTVNLNDRKLYKVPVGTSSDPLTPSSPAAADIDSYDVINDILNNGDDLGINPQQNIRPFALSIKDGLVYFGMVNTAQYDATGSAGTPNGVGGSDDTTSSSDLRAYVYTFDPENPNAAPAQILDIPLNYDRDYATSFGNTNEANWLPWVESFPSDRVIDTGEEAYPQAIFSDIDFDPDGNMLLGFRDRWGDQVGRQVNRPDGTGSAGLTANTGGDLLTAIFDPNTGNYTIETHVTTDNINGNNDPDGELFDNEFFENGGANDSNELHSETAQGGLAVVPGFTEVVTTALDPINAFSGGFEWFNTEDGSFAGHTAANGDSGLEIFSGGGFSKSNGLGDIEFIADPTKITIGDRIWDDTNQDGIQNGGETNFDFDGNGTGSNDTITVELYNSAGTLIDTTTTTDGEYYFTDLDPFTDYEVRLATSNFTSGAALDGYLSTLQNTGSNDDIDSDATNSAGLPSISFTTGASGANDYSFDFGLTNTTTTDYGDAPDTTSGTDDGDYQTTAANSGASHTLGSGLTIGSGVTADDGTLQNTDADADSDDGVTFGSTLQTDDTTFSVDVDVNLPSGTSSANLIGWIDFDQSGTFDEDEDASATVTSSGSQTLTWNSFPGIIDGTTYSRFRLSTDINLDENYSTGVLDDGEVEDYKITVGRDYGDAPDDTDTTVAGDYQTIDRTGTANDGASHGIKDGLTIGSIVDADNGTLENANADNDDTDGSDDEDGVTFTSALSPDDDSYSVDVDITNTTGSNAVLTGWIDFDQNGQFESSNTNGDNERVSIVVSESGTQTLTWDTSSVTIPTGSTYARFRLSQDFTTTTTPVNSTVYSEDFEGTVTGWTVGGEIGSDTATAGLWEIGTSSAYTIQGTNMQLAANGGTGLLVTDGQGNTNDQFNGNVDGGFTTARSDTFPLESGSGTHTVNLSYFFSSYTSNVTDEFTVSVVNANDTEDNAVIYPDTVASGATQAAAWTQITETIDSSFNGKTVYLEFKAQDGGSGDAVEAGVDDISVTYSGTEEVTNPLDATGALDDGEVEDYKINIGIDYGDAPDTTGSAGTGDYQTTADNGGASHVIKDNLTIGTNLDADDGTLQNTDADADNTDNTNDEDGVTFASNLEIDDTSYTVTVKATNNTGTGDAAKLVGWIDFNQNGQFESSEAVVANVPDTTNNADVTLTWDDVTGSSTGNLTGNGDLPTTILPGTTYARFRLSTDADFDGDNALGAAGDGEVEDYKLTVGLDYGDARDPQIGTGTSNYNTTAEDNGASHIIDTDISLGANVDADDGTLQNADATADDDDQNNGSIDDEDGVTISNTLRTDSTSFDVTVDINNDTGSTATLIGWIDFDQSGTFDADEATTATYGADATGQTLSWANGTIPDDITDGLTYARFRLSTDEDLNANTATGQLDDGEVEDYQINIVAVDYGDAPDVIVGETNPIPGEYATTLADDGARHLIVDGLKLGETVDAENGTLQNTAADADDLDNNNDDDDEDGVIFNDSLSISNASNDTDYSVTIDYTNSTGSNAEIVAWIDFDQSGTFDSDEATSITGIASNVEDQTDQTLTWTGANIPADIKGGTTYARFRISNNTATLDNSYSEGELSSGEVEDYQIIIEGGIDYGDASKTGGDSYAATTTSHPIIEGLKIGTIVDDDDNSGTANYTLNTAATADDLDNTDDEDGVTFTSNLETTDTEYSVEVEVEAADLPASLSASDNFANNNYSGGTGWTNNWTESGESDGAGVNGSVGTFNNQIFNRSSDADGIGISRQFDFSLASGDATLSFDYAQFRLESGESFIVQVDDGLGGTPVTVLTIDDSTTSSTTTNTSSGNITIDKSLLTSTTTIRILPNVADQENASSLEGVVLDNINITAPVSPKLVGWIDFDGDGVFEPGEGTSTTVTSSGTETLTWSSLQSLSNGGGGIVAGDTYARFRLSTSSFDENNATGSLANGEVEDYKITITSSDYGDAPDTGTGTGTNNYKTTEEDDGASHQIVSGLSLGGSVDADDGTLQDIDSNTGTNADDSTGSPDDEDGVFITNPLTVVDSTYSVTFDITNSTGNDVKLIGWIDFDQSGTFDADEAATYDRTGANGSVTGETLTWSSIPSDILPGDTYARFRLSNDTTTLTTSYSTDFLSSGEIEDYKITIGAADYGDAPDTVSGTATGDYETTSINGGAAHGINTNIRLGDEIDGDSGTLQNTNATEDDNDGNPDDEDGVTSTLTDIATGDTSYSVTLDVFNNSGSSAKLIGWIDFDRSGTFDEDEAVIRTIGSTGTTSSQTLTWDTNNNGFPSDIIDGTTYARFRLSTDTDTLTKNYATGILSDGEVEDYKINIVGVDYGDAPDDGVSGNSAGDYQSTEANSGASHIIIDDLYLGGSVDADNGRLTDIDATEDDLNGSDDENGVTFNEILSKNSTDYSVDLVVTNETGGNAKLVGWIDFNQNGSFEASEAETLTVPNAIGGQNVSLDWTGLSGITAGTTYARFRLTTDTDLDVNNILETDSVGEFDSGEVEDYQINVEGGKDYGDAPDDGINGTGTGDYQTTDKTGTANDGASHDIVANLYLGDLVDEDDGTLENSSAVADDNDTNNDEDGVTFTSILEEGDSSYSVSVDVTNNTGGDAELIGWIDFNQNGSFEASEAKTVTISSNVAKQTTSLTWDTSTTTILDGSTYARFRLTTDSSFDPLNILDTDSVGNFSDGEVEDYHLCVASSGKSGTTGADDIDADSGGSVFVGYKGRDTLSGADDGVDHFCYTETSNGVDIIDEFTVDSGGDQIILTQILRDEVGYTGSNPIGDGYVVLYDYGVTGTMVQIDFDGNSGDLLAKDVALIVDTNNADINETILGNNNLVF